MTRTLSDNSILPDKSQSFSIVWTDTTDSICDLPCLLTYLNNHTINCHRTDTTRTSLATGRRDRRVSNGVTALSSLQSPSSLPQSPLRPRHAPVSAPAPTAGVFAGIHSRSGDLVDRLTRSGSFVFLRDLFDTERLFELRDFRMARVMSKGKVVEQFAANMRLVLDLANKYPRDSLAAHILDCVA
jgi:hypothetical protein